MYEDITDIMQKSISVSSLNPEILKKLTYEEVLKYNEYFSIDEENKLVIKTLNILKEAKLRKRGNTKFQ